MNRNDRPLRPWWRKKRWLSVGALWLLVWYPLSSGPYYYCMERNWLPGYYPLDGFWDPIVLVLAGRDALSGPVADAPRVFKYWTAYNRYFYYAAQRHREAAE